MPMLVTLLTATLVTDVVDKNLKKKVNKRDFETTKINVTFSHTVIPPPPPLKGKNNMRNDFLKIIYYMRLQ